MKDLIKKNLFLIIAGIGLYLLSTGISYATFSYFKKPGTISPISPQVTEEGGFKVDVSAPKTEVCPLNGAKYTKSEKEAWEKLRPLTVMIENHQDARPQSGLSRADVIYEAVAEGGITRFLAVFYCGQIAQAKSGTYDLGPVRSARTYFLNIASEYADYPLYVHVGGANLPGPANALGQIGDYGWLAKGNDLNQFSLGYTICRREPERTGHTVATEHSMYCDSFALWQEALRRKLGAVDEDNNRWDKKFVAWSFKDEKASGESVSPEFNFWQGYQEYQVKWEYDQSTNSYKRINGSASLTDNNNKEQLIAKNVIIQFARERATGDAEKHLLYDNIGEGKALIFQDGRLIQGKWTKKDRQSRTKFLDSGGKEVKFNPGQIWIELLPTGVEVNY
jgi:hypothetical protein